MPLYVKDAGTWKTVTSLSVKDGGTWKTVTSGKVKDGGTWKEFFVTGGGGGYDYTISASTISTGSTSSVVQLQLNSSAATGETWTVTSTGSNPAGFYDSSSFSISGNAFGMIQLSSVCKTASPGTRILLNYNVTCAVDGGETVEPEYIQVVHQF